ncbi:MAG: hypothetical protein ACIAQ0_00345 [Phycisphaerales bacterium JB058]
MKTIVSVSVGFCLTAGIACGEPVRFDVPISDPQFPGWWMLDYSQLDVTQAFEDNLYGPTWESESTFASLMYGGMASFYYPQEGLSAGNGFGASKGVLTTPGDQNPLAVPLQYGATIDQNSGTFTRDGYYYASAQRAVDPKSTNMFEWYYYESNFTPDETAYVGLMFLIDGQTHYGWAEVLLIGSEPVVGTSLGSGLTAYVSAWGYETEPGAPAVAGVPAPASGALIGLAGIAATRRRR